MARLLTLSAALLAVTSTGMIPSAFAVEPAVRRRVDPAERRIDTSQAKPSNVTQFRVVNSQHTNKKPFVGNEPKRSPISKAAFNEVIEEPLPHLMNVDAGCGYETGCGIETSCGAEFGAPCDCDNPTCGMEATCGVDNTCGLEGCDSCGVAVGCDSTAGCDSVCGMPANGDCIPLLLPVTRINWSQFELFAGVQGFSGPTNYAGNGVGRPRSDDGTASFGLNEGFNFSRPFMFLGGGISSQLGLRATQTNASGAEFTNDNRKQVFLTAGLFRRVDYGLQGGVVFDYLYDDWYYNVHLTQLRSELSWAFDCNEFGYGYTASLQDDTSAGVIIDNTGALANVNVALRSLDQHRFFYRRHFREVGYAEMFAGFTDESDGLLGASFKIPLLRDLAMQTGFTYMNPNLSGGLQDNQEETWNVGFGFTWYPGGGRGRSRYDRPFFEVADNGNFLVDQQ